MDLDKILKEHSLWLNGDAAGKRANLSGTYLYGANLYGANLYGANLSGANLSGANLYRANLSEVTVNWQSHQLLSEILLRAAEGNATRRSLAGLVRVSEDWCWDVWLTLDHPEREWALVELRKWVKPGDDAPEALR